MSFDLYNPSPEQLLSLMLLSQPRGGDATALAALARRADWTRFLRSTDFSLYPFLHFVLNKNGVSDFVPLPVQAILERAKTDALLRYMRRKIELQRLFAMFDDNGIEAVVLKGASLGELVYPMPYLRPMRDVDLWIPEAQMSRAHSLLERDGYREKRVRGLENDPRDGREIRLAKFFNYDLSVIEIHSTLDIHLPADKDETGVIWQRCMEHSDLGARTLHPRDMLHHLCMHLAFRHRFEQGLLWLLDIRLLLERFGSQMDWAELSEESRRQQTSKYVYISLEMVVGLLRCALPEVTFTSLEPPKDLRKMKLLAWRQIWYSSVAALPPRKMLKFATAGSPNKMWQFTLHRLHKYSTSNSPNHQQPEGLLQRARSALQWAGSDLRKSYSALRSGAFSPANLQKAYEMEIRRTEFEKGMQA